MQDRLYEPRRRIMTRSLFSTLLAALLALGTSACTDNQDTLILTRGNLFPGSVDLDTATCQFNSDGDQFLSSGLLDTLVSNSYSIRLSVAHAGPESNQVGVKEGQGGQTFDQLNIEGNNIIMQNALLSYTLLGGGGLSDIEVPVTGILQPNGTAFISIPALNADQVAQIPVPNLVLVDVQVSGLSTSNTTVDSNAFQYPIEVCNGCGGLAVLTDPYICYAGFNPAGLLAFFCSNQQQDAVTGESDADCGGECLNIDPSFGSRLCANDKNCVLPTDCQSGFCDADGQCANPPSCTDGEQNGDEADVDCGGPDCPGCLDGSACTAASDCANNNCFGGTCISCGDGAQNGLETDVDCGGGTCGACADGRSCLGNADCTGSICNAGTCAAPTCNDSAQNGTETGVDCGGTCLACTGTACAANTDCASGTCDVAGTGLCL